nr:PREDICTED: uncharacterized protein LOC105663289 isoform X4 [Megachile rotundata]
MQYRGRYSAARAHGLEGELITSQLITYLRAETAEQRCKRVAERQFTVPEDIADFALSTTHPALLLGRRSH